MNIVCVYLFCNFAGNTKYSGQYGVSQQYGWRWWRRMNARACTWIVDRACTEQSCCASDCSWRKVLLPQIGPAHLALSCPKPIMKHKIRYRQNARLKVGAVSVSFVWQRLSRAALLLVKPVYWKLWYQPKCWVWSFPLWRCSTRNYKNNTALLSPSVRPSFTIIRSPHSRRLLG